MTLLDDEAARARSYTPRAEVERCRFSSRDEAEIVDFLASVYDGSRSSFTPGAEDPALDAEAACVPDLATDQVRCTLDYRLDTEPIDHFSSFVVQAGSVRLSRRGERASLRTGDVALLTLGAGVRLHLSDIRVGALRLPMARIRAVAGEVCDRPVDWFVFETMTPVSPAMHRYWRSTMTLARGALMAPDSPMATELLREQTIRAVALAALHTFPNTALGRHDRDMPRPGEVAPAAIRRAIAHIDDHAEKPLTLTDIAVAAGTGTRALQYGFQRHYGTTPMGYLRVVRLERAHRDLRAADPTTGDTVADVARRWGFGNLSRFARVYRDRFGVPPSRTLRA